MKFLIDLNLVDGLCDGIKNERVRRLACKMSRGGYPCFEIFLDADGGGRQRTPLSQ